MNKLIYLIIFLIVSLFSCKNSIEKKSSLLKTIDLSNVYHNEEEVYLSAIADSISYIALQTDSNVLLDKIDNPWMNVQFSKDMIFVSDRNQLLVFDLSGKFKNKIGCKGKGPGEFTHVDNFTILEKKQQVVILNLYKQELLIYNFKGSFIKSVKTDIYPSEIASFNNELIVLGNTKGNRIFSNYNTVSILDEDYKIQNTLISHKDEIEIEKKNKIARFQLANFYIYCDTLSHWEFQYDTIWRIPKTNVAFPAYRIELGKEKLPFKYVLDEFVTQDQGEFINTERILETKSFFFFNIAYKKFLKHVLYCKENDSAICIKYTRKGEPYFSFVNDIDGGLPFWPDGVIDKDRIFSLIFGIELKFKINENLRNDKFQSTENKFSNLLKNTQLTDNPIIMIVKLKR